MTLSRVSRNTRSIFAIVCLSFAAAVFIAYFFFYASNDRSPIHALKHWVGTIKYPNIGICDNDTIRFGEGAAVVNAGRMRSDIGCSFSVWLDPFDLLTLGIGDSAGRKEYAMEMLDKGARLGRFDKATYVFTTDGDTIYLELGILSASDLMGYHYHIDILFPGNRYDMGLSGTGIDVPMALDAIKKYAYRDEGRAIAYDRALTEGFLR